MKALGETWLVVPGYQAMLVRGDDVGRIVQAVSHFAKLEDMLRTRARELRLDDTERATQAATQMLLRTARGMLVERPHLGRGYWLDGVGREDPLYTGAGDTVVT